MRADKPTDVSEIDDEEEEPGEEVESAPPLKVGEERELGCHGTKKKLLKRGRGWETPALGDEATVHYVATLPDGTKFDSTREKNEPLVMKLGQGQVTRGLDQGIFTMTKGEIALFILLPEMGYGVDGFEGIALVPPNSVVHFEVELISWISVSDVGRDGGIIKKVLQRGDRSGTPGELDEVLVRYRAELVDGTLVAEASQGVEFYVKDGHLCQALAKAIRTMEKGEKARLIVQPQYAFEEQGRDASEGLHSIPPSSILHIDVELVSFKPVIDIIGNGKVLKKILREGQGQSADEGATVTITLTARLEDGSVFEKKGIDGVAPLTFVTDEGWFTLLNSPLLYTLRQVFFYSAEQVITGLDIATSTMRKGEQAVLTIHPDYGFGNTEAKRDLSTVPPCSTLVYVVEMLECIKLKAPWEISNLERLEEAGKKKEEGNLLYKSGKYQRAVKKYDKAVEYVSEEVYSVDDELKLAKALRVSCWLNGAACSLKLYDFQAAIKLCSKVLDVESQNVKALYRRAQAYMGTEDLVLADLDIKKALEADTKNKDVKLIHRNLKQRQAERNKRDAKLYANMFSHSNVGPSNATKKLKVDEEAVKENRKEEVLEAMEVENVAGILAMDTDVVSES